MENSVQVFLKLNSSCFTRLVWVPSNCVHTDYRLPLQTPLNMAAINHAQPILDGYKKTPVLVFRANGEMQQNHPVMELTGIENY